MTTTPDLTPGGTGEGVDRREFAVEGMTCASCAARVQKTLNKQVMVFSSVSAVTNSLRLRRFAGADR